MKQRFIRPHEIKGKQYYPGEDADFLSEKDAKKLVKEGIVAYMAIIQEPEEEEDEQ